MSLTEAVYSTVMSMENAVFPGLNSVSTVSPRAEHAALRADQVNGGLGSDKLEDVRGYAVLSCP